MKYKKISLLVLVALARVPMVANAEQSATTEANIEILAGEDPVEPEIPIDPPTGQEGPLTIDAVSSFDFGVARLGAEKVTAIVAEDKILGVQVSDKRGNGIGWSLTAEISAFENESKTRQLRGAKVTIAAGKVDSKQGNPLFPPVASEIILAGSFQNILVAEKENGLGTWTEDFHGTNKKVQLEVPPDAYVDMYNAEITWSLQDAPK
ncbi:WxL domain-containing protein [Carnobacterium maltaromaticum]|uniref:WxL domain-containing protein n=1 Tax=Carnobacterium maltaromaticum TaxID=2751 RepID=UPI0039BDE868